MQPTAGTGAPGVLRALHTSVTVDDIDRSIKCYCVILGMEVRVRQFSDTPYIGTLTGFPGAQLEVALLGVPGDDHVLELVEYKEPRGALGTAAPNAIAGHHFCLLVSGIDELARRLRQAGAELVSDPVEITHGVNRGAKGFYFRDPDGHVVELHERAR
jgi:catechol 2,3-dioxygenase-like lactoylglutathione lyase family enzyme